MPSSIVLLFGRNNAAASVTRVVKLGNNSVENLATLRAGLLTKTMSFRVEDAQVTQVRPICFRSNDNQALCFDGRPNNAEISGLLSYFDCPKHSRRESEYKLWLAPIACERDRERRPLDAVDGRKTRDVPQASR